MNNKKKKSHKKDSQLLLRIGREERDEFVALCEELDTSAAREIRRFIKKFIAEHNGNQATDVAMLPPNDLSDETTES